ncbi:MAG TPA: c-type cytochrome [Anaerolineae bacterium]|nr:c-type cytochrome [Anaerolineae bacterium]
MRHRDWSFQPHVLRRAGIIAIVLCLALLGACRDAVDESQREIVVDGDPHQGEAAIRRYGCPACHTIPGVAGADGVVGPPLSFWADRVYIAGLLENSADNLTHFIRNPQEVVPGGAMPDMGVTEEDARHIAAYLYTLRRAPLINFGGPEVARQRDPLGRPAPGGEAAQTTTQAGAEADDTEEGTAAAQASPVPEETRQALVEEGEGLYGQQCAECHQSDGQGTPGTFPPLAGNPDLAQTEFVIAVVIHGLDNVPIEVAGTTYQGVMPAFGEQLSDVEIAAILSYVRTSWDNEWGAVAPEAVAEVRDSGVMPEELLEGAEE